MGDIIYCGVDFHAWEWINDPRYPVQYGVVAYKVGMNVVTYVMSH